MDYINAVNEINDLYDNIRAYFIYYDDTVFIGECAHVMTARILHDNLSIEVKTIPPESECDICDLCDELAELEDLQNCTEERSGRWWGFETEIDKIQDEIIDILEDL